MICPVCGIYLRVGDMVVGVPVAAQTRGDDFFAICELAHVGCVGRKGDENMGIDDEPSIPPVRTNPSREPPAPTLTHAVMVISPDAGEWGKASEAEYSRHTNYDSAMTVALDLAATGKYIHPLTVWVTPLGEID